ncbi:MAG TPA: surface lipoprotein assembly modifier [Novosphingobium sp.]|nr:surface lipoprotein assembly modifier [Novosphingobium sp.]
MNDCAWRLLAFSLLLFAPCSAVAGDAGAPTQLIRLENLSADDVLAIAGRLIDAGRYEEAQRLLDQLARDNTGGIERDFLDGMLAVARKDFARAETLFRKILQADPSLVRVRLELGRTLFLEKDDEQADYNFRLAIAQNPPETVIKNIARFREAIRARRAWRFNFNVSIAPDTNINSATSKDHVDVLGLPFELDEDAKARSGVGLIAGGDASVRIWRFAKVPLYVAAYGRAVVYKEHDFDDIYVGGEAGPEFRLAGGRLRATASAFRRWYGGDTLVTSPGGRLAFDKVIGGKWSLDASLALRRDNYARRRDLDAWNIDAGLSANRALSPSTLGFGYVSVRRGIARDPGYSNWSARIGGGVLKEIGWGLRPQLSFEVGRQINDAKLGLFGRTRRDWSILASASIYKRDWNIAGFAPSIRLTWSRNFSSIALYDQKRLRTEFGMTKAF